MKKLIVLLFVLGSLLAVWAETPADDFNYIWGSDYELRTDMEYNIVNYYYFFLDAENDEHARTDARLHKEIAESADTFYFENAEDNWYYIVNTQMKGVLQCNPSRETNSVVSFQPRSGDASQKWRLIPSAEDNYYYIVSYSNSHVLAGLDGKTINGQKLALRNFTGYKGQLWRVEKVRE
ncbi:MAG: RICIN domain-containing protein [Candidatus Cloacimonetes bacterium]|nr:RICIN domain-containing protein [Candidatus Cloacimonadota bacterium]